VPWLDVLAASCAAVDCGLRDCGTVDAGPLVCEPTDRGVSARVCVTAAVCTPRAFGEVCAVEVDFHDELEQAQKSAVARTALYLISRPGSILDVGCDAS
jgi:hypothetical protein